MNTFGEYLKERRKALKMTMSDVQAVAGVSQPSMSLFEKGTKIPSKRLLIKLADLYDVSHEEMIQRAEDAKQMMEPTEKSPTPPAAVKAVAASKIHRFICIDGHTFYIPLELPISIEDMMSILTPLQCPICHCGSKNISLNMKEYIITE